MTNKAFQNAISQMQEIGGNREIGILDDELNVVACSEVEKNGKVLSLPFYRDEYESRATAIHEGFTYKPFSGSGKPEYIAFVEGTDEIASTIATMLTVSLNIVKQHYEEKYDRNNFVKNIILDNIFHGEIGIKARELHFNPDVTRVALLIRVGSQVDVSVLEVIRNLFPDKSKDFVFNISENDVVLVKEIRHNTDTKNLEKLARSVSDTLSGEFFTRSVIGIGLPVTGIRELARSFRDAQTAIEVGKVFDTDKSIISYSNLGIARLIYHLPTALCDTFLAEVFKRGGTIETLDHEIMFTIQRFFENSLNVSETARKLFVHRNTLVYRLDKIKKMTGLDLRDFEDAIVFKLALMVKKYLLTNPMKF
ncbi:MAG: helix-turn-helix domain-containing protein [Oscillospiraceae bacterium]|nr:helix-turn-helix domain-containing protein [Oscillospiraceae bacterium]